MLLSLYIRYIYKIYIRVKERILSDLLLFMLYTFLHIRSLSLHRLWMKCIWNKY